MEEGTTVGSFITEDSLAAFEGANGLQIQPSQDSVLYFLKLFSLLLIRLIIVLSVALRKLEAKRRNVEGKLARPNIVRDCTDSQTCAPKMGTLQ